MDVGSERKDEQPVIVLNRRLECHTRLPRMTNGNWDQRIKVDVDEFEGRLLPEEFLDCFDRVEQLPKWKKGAMKRN